MQLGTSLAHASTRAGVVAKGVSQSVERFVCGDESALTHAAKQQEQIVSPKDPISSTAIAEGIKSPTKAALGKYTLRRLLVGDYKCSDCVSDLAIGTVDILCMGYCDGGSSKGFNADTNGEFDDMFSYRTDVLSPQTALSPNTVLSPNTTFEDSTAQAFTFDSIDSTHTEEEAPQKTENRKPILHTVETPVANNNCKNNKCTRWAKGFSPKAGGGKGMRDNEEVAIELLMSDIPSTNNQATAKSTRRSFFRKEAKETPKPTEDAGYTVKVVMSGSSTASEKPGIAPSTSSSAAKSGSSGECSAKSKNRMKIAMKSFRRSKQDAKGKVDSHGGVSDTGGDSGGGDGASIQLNETKDGQQSLYSM